jgi:hypothetical protein
MNNIKTKTEQLIERIKKGERPGLTAIVLSPEQVKVIADALSQTIDDQQYLEYVVKPRTITIADGSTEKWMEDQQDNERYELWQTAQIRELGTLAREAQAAGKEINWYVVVAIVLAVIVITLRVWLLWI